MKHVTGFAPRWALHFDVVQRAKKDGFEVTQRCCSATNVRAEKATTSSRRVAGGNIHRVPRSGPGIGVWLVDVVVVMVVVVVVVLVKSTARHAYIHVCFLTGWP